MQNLDPQDYEIESLPDDEYELDEPEGTETAVEMQLLLARVQAARSCGA